MFISQLSAEDDDDLNREGLKTSLKAKKLPAKLKRPFIIYHPTRPPAVYYNKKVPVQPFPYTGNDDDGIVNDDDDETSGDVSLKPVTYRLFASPHPHFLVGCHHHDGEDHDDDGEKDCNCLFGLRS